MPDERSEFMKELLHKMAMIDYIRPGEVPNINLYMDQVTTFMDTHLESTKRSESDKILTKTMINNYAKNNLLPPPVKKKYSKDHVITLMFIYYFKNLMSIGDIQAVLQPLTEQFFGGSGSVSLDHIYKEIYQSERERLPHITKDIISMFQKAGNSFENVTDPNEKDYLQIFSFVCYLCFDMYMKKVMVENIIDEFAAGRTFKGEVSKKDAKKAPAGQTSEKKTEKKSERTPDSHAEKNSSDAQKSS